ncbi:VOC family protein [Fredinandcohnia sp. QZ13]|uniref:VOC family protein n=1 Tax=Fredinandcohnia sp. QZ13 TaxID=3073144 RepID=UPI0028531BD0|nr:VOC family protein [Fredinandcohnia sp. QZ13]MDR4889729.1 VOC family protein [Fredinandcohnia sp. QZ13]
MKQTLQRVGTTYLPVTNVQRSATWYTENLEATLNYMDEDKAILDLADQSFFLVASKEGQTSNFIDAKGHERFSVTFEVDGVQALENLHKEFKERHITVGEIEDRGHVGKNFVFEDPDGNLFDVWSELSPIFKKRRNENASITSD